MSGSSDLGPSVLAGLVIAGGALTLGCSMTGLGQAQAEALARPMVTRDIVYVIPAVEGRPGDRLSAELARALQRARLATVITESAPDADDHRWGEVLPRVEVGRRRRRGAVGCFRPHPVHRPRQPGGRPGDRRHESGAPLAIRLDAPGRGRRSVDHGRRRTAGHGGARGPCHLHEPGERMAVLLGGTDRNRALGLAILEMILGKSVSLPERR